LPARRLGIIADGRHWLSITSVKVPQLIDVDPPGIQLNTEAVEQLIGLGRD
jgi:hypothetical protein